MIMEGMNDINVVFKCYKCQIKYCVVYEDVCKKLDDFKFKSWQRIVVFKNKKIILGV